MIEPQDKVLPFKGYNAIDPGQLDTFPYEFPGREIELLIETDEFTAVCPFSGLPDFGTVRVRYVPGSVCIELRSFKYYLLSYRDVGIYYEHAVNRIIEDLVACCNPVRMTVELDYKIRGGMTTSAVATYPGTLPKEQE
jgi:7-cyano-7-deazaguanine reductase